VSFDKRSSTFRNVAGVSRQLSTLQWSLKNNIDASIGDIFYEVYEEFKDHKEKLHNIAQSIRRCTELARNILFADESEMNGFCEGALLAHMHLYLEKQFGDDRSNDVVRCHICSINCQHIYNKPSNGGFLQPHLLIPPERYESDIKLTKKDFITVCPNCHIVLHQTRPWVSAEYSRTILKTL
jgi:5-methylcytosine-specific restriction protein A